jgi:hypothetical protein
VTIIGQQPPVIVTTRGSDINFSLVWPGEDEEPADLDGWDLTLMDVSPEFSVEIDQQQVDLLTASIVDPANGLIEGKIDWHDSLQTRARYGFRIQVSLNGDDQSATELIQVRYV